MANLKAGATVQGSIILHAGNFDPSQYAAMKGLKGDAGAQGSKGDTGQKGPKGTDGELTKQLFLLSM